MTKSKASGLIFDFTRTVFGNVGPIYGIGKGSFGLRMTYFDLLESFPRTYGTEFSLPGHEFTPPEDEFRILETSGTGFGLWETFWRVLEAGFGFPETFGEGPGQGFGFLEPFGRVLEAGFGLWEGPGGWFWPL